ncbi:c-type cytochrome [Halomonas sp. DQ26W]|uniref:c-type cytochrome n=1 Tax=Halomonas sp. DQ26W TaxID=2282311 RepID=UPI0015EFE2AA|nr:c-type cytochrome [Halomonas sp. DQ26W]
MHFRKGGFGRRSLAWVSTALTLLLALPAAGEGLDEGQRLYDFYCYQCHAYSGTGETVAARTLDPPPRDLTGEWVSSLSREQLVTAVRDGRPGTGMVPFGEVMGEAGVEAVVDYVIATFMQGEASDARYHTEANGWPDHEARYAVAFPFARGELALDTPVEELSERELRGKRLFLSGCVTCHESGVVRDPGPVWETRAVSFPRGRYDHRNPPTGAGPLDAISGASPYLRHELAPTLPEGASEQVVRGETLYQDNCAFCHAPDGSGRNWIGSFLEPRPRDLTAPTVMRHMTPSRLAAVIRQGLPETSMPAWEAVLDEAEIAAMVAYIDALFHPLAKDSEAAISISPPSPRSTPAWQRHATSH